MPPTERPDVPADLGDGLTLRRAGPADVEPVARLCAAAFGPADGPAARAVMTRGEGGPGAWTVVTDRTRRVVSASARLPRTYLLDGVALPGSQPEYVVTDPAHQGRGLVRAQFELHHSTGARAGDLLQLIGGIPYYYRRFGYGYGLDAAPRLLVEPARVERHGVPGVLVRTARASDVPALAGAHGPPREGVAVVRTEAAWDTWLAMGEGRFGVSTWTQLLVAEQDGRLQGSAAVWLDVRARELFVDPTTPADPDGARAILAEAVRRAGAAQADGGGPVLVLVTHTSEPGWAEATDGAGPVVTPPTGVFARVPDEVGFLRAIRALLDWRLASSAASSVSLDLTLSLYERGILLRLRGGRVLDVAAAPPVQDPFAEGGVGIAPDRFPALVLGRWGAAGLAERADDVVLGAHGELLEVLFPARPADVAVDL